MATIKDVARRAGVAPSTVSYALSGKRPISAEARKKIADVISELDFTPSALGRQLVRGRSNMIGLVYPVRDAELEYETLEFLPVAADLLHKNGYGLSLFTGPMAPQHILDLYRNNTVDGLIIMQINRQDARVDILRDKGYPLTLIGRCSRMKGLTSVDFDAENAVYLLFERLHHLGHRIVGYLDHTREVHQREKYGYAWLVQRGFERALKAFEPKVVIEQTTDTAQSTYAATCALLQREPRLTAIVTIRRIMPIGALHALRDHGRRVPEDCTLLGITTSAFAQYSTPQLTSADLPLNDMVRTGAELVLQQLAGEGQPRQIIFPARIVDRETAAPIKR
jgi:DNA-binding LacI/PurR family transcriptional regulator